jgi:hypothetical protein
MIELIYKVGLIVIVFIGILLNLLLLKGIEKDAEEITAEADEDASTERDWERVQAGGKRESGSGSGEIEPVHAGKNA